MYKKSNNSKAGTQVHAHLYKKLLRSVMAEKLVGVAPGSGWHTERYDATRFMALHQGVPQSGIWWITWPSRQLMNCTHTVSPVPPCRIAAQNGQSIVSSARIRDCVADGI